jgi:hypothetical protein
MIVLGWFDLLLLLLLVVTLVGGVSRHFWWPVTVVVVVVGIIFVERLVPGTLAAAGEAIRDIDQINVQMPHIRIPVEFTTR